MTTKEHEQESTATFRPALNDGAVEMLANQARTIEEQAKRIADLRELMFGDWQVIFEHRTTCDTFDAPFGDCTCGLRDKLA